MKWLTSLLALVAAVLPTQQAHAWLKFCNETDQTVSVAYRRYYPPCDGDKPSWWTLGWYNIAPGACSLVQNGSLQNKNFSRYYYWHARSFDGQHFWNGPYNIAIADEGKDHKDCGDDTIADCGRILPDGRFTPSECGPEPVNRPAREVDIGKNDNYTINIKY